MELPTYISYHTHYSRRCDLDEDGSNVPLTCPRRMRHIVGDGNRLFHSFTYLTIGIERQHTQVRLAILNHLRRIERWMLPFFRMQYSSATKYISGTNMERNRGGGGG